MSSSAAARDQLRRLPEGGRIDRSRPLAFTFDGRSLTGFEGDTLASAMLANGVDVVGRSFKFARRRGVVGHGAEEPNAIVTVGEGDRSLPNLRATQVGLYDGLVARAAANHALKRLAGVAARLMPAGFYYKTFMGSWPFWEHLLRNAAGLGNAPTQSDPDVYDHLNHQVDVLVVGAGPAGLAAALKAARAGAGVVLADEQAELGGSLLAASDSESIGAVEAERWIADAVAELRSLDAVLLPRTTVFGGHDHGFFTALETRTDHLPPAIEQRGPRSRLHRIRAEQTILATGAFERPLVFANNDLPGVMLASAVRAYLNRYAVAAGEKLLLFTTNDDAYRVAMDWQSAGREVVAVVDARPWLGGEWPGRAKAAGIDVMSGHGVVEALGGKRVEGALVARLEERGGRFEVASKPNRLACDLIACSGGWSPTVHLSSQTGAKPVWNEAAVAFLPGELRRGLRCAGSVAGARALRDCLEQGARAGSVAAASAGFGDGTPSPEWNRPSTENSAPSLALFHVPHP